VRIDLVSEHASPLAVLGGVDAGGQNVHVAALGRALAGAGERVRVFTRRDACGLPEIVPFGAGAEVVHIDAGPPCPVPKDELWAYMPAFADQLHRYWSEDRPDVAHAHFWMSGWATHRAALSLGIPVAITYHALGSVKRRQQGDRDTSPTERITIERDLAIAADVVLATARAEAHELACIGASCSNVSVVACGVDLSHFAPKALPAPRPGRLAVLIVSRLVERKGIGNVIEALAGVKGAQLTVAGGPRSERVDSDPDVRHFRAIAERHGVSDRVRFLGAVDRAELPALVQAHDVITCCPWYEPFGLVALEAMACGRPVVASAVGGLAETVLDGATGVLVPPRDPDAIAGALRALRDSTEMRRRLGDAAAVRARAYGWDRIADSTRQAYRKLLTGARVGDPEAVGGAAS